MPGQLHNSAAMFAFVIFNLKLGNSFLFDYVLGLCVYVFMCQSLHQSSDVAPLQILSKETETEKFYNALEKIV